MGRKVTVIPPTISLQTHQPTTQKVRRKVAGYARVSTDFEEQLTSYEAQVDYYTKYIQEREDWEFVKVYTDEGISATSTVHRDGFNQMVADALDGKIDLIVTKSVSRFARNTVDSLTTVRKLKEKGVEISAVCDVNKAKLALAQKRLELADGALYAEEETFFRKGKLADLLIVSTQDQLHLRHAVKGLDLGYDLLLEKPIAASQEECETILNKAQKLDRRVFVCHVLRYAPFFSEIKRRLSSGKYGKVVTIAMTENVAYWHQAHSFVRGNWRNEEESTFMLLAKCCHDLDMIAYLSGKKCRFVSSMGHLSFFTAENAPENSAAYCYRCGVNDCPYNALNWYVKNPLWVKLPELPEENRDAFIRNWLSDEKNPYARCVFHCDNDVVDHQVVNMQFEDMSTATLTMTAFTDKFYRRTHVFCTKGEIYGDMEEKKLYCTVFGREQTVIDLKDSFNDSHGGGDQGLIDDVVDMMNGRERSGRTDIEAWMISHRIAFAAEKSRRENGARERL